MKIENVVRCLSLLIILQACENELVELPQGNRAKEATFTSAIGDRVMSRAVNTSWEANDVIGLFMLGNADKAVLKANAAYVTPQGDGHFVGKAGNTVYYPEDGTAVDFIAYYPYDEKLTSYNRYTLDVTDQSRQQDIDLMVATNLTDRTASSVTGNLQFRHLLAKLVLNLNSADGSSLAGIEAMVQGLKNKATVDLSKEDDNITLGDATDAVPMYVDEGCTQAEAVLIPQPLEGKLKITLSVNGREKEIETDIAGSIEAGARYTVNLSISNTGGSTTVDPEASGYAKWFETPVITEAQKENGDLMYITHYTDKKYADTGRPDMEGKKIRNYSMLYDTKMKMAYWVAYPLHSYYTVKGEGVGRKDRWISDPIVSNTGFQAVVSSSYSGNTYRRGHQIPSNDRVGTQSMNDQTFYFTNQTPQRQNKFNGAIWMNLEHKINGWSTASDTVYVVTGAVPPSDDATWIKEKSIEDNDGKDIPIPSYYFKAVARKINGKYHTIAFWLQHKDYANANAYMDYAISVSELEEHTHFEFFPGLDESIKKELDKSKWQ